MLKSLPPVIKARQGLLTGSSGLALALALLSLAIWSGLLPVPFALAESNYLAIHSAGEIFAVVVALLIFSTGYHALDRQNHAGSLFLACAFLGVGLLDLLHTLSYPGMPDLITVNTNHKSISLWLAARLLAAVALLAFALIPLLAPKARWPRGPVLTAILLYTAITGYLAFFLPQAIPATYVEGEGLTVFKISLEWLFIGLHLVTLALIVHRRERFSPALLSYLPPALVILAASGLLFTVYQHATDGVILLGHLFKLAGYLLLYRAIFIENIQLPYHLLKDAQRELTLLNYAMDHVNEAAYLVNREGRFEYVNAGAARALGHNRGELLALGVEDVDPDFPQARWPQHWRELVDKGNMVFEGRHRDHQGRIFPVEINANYFEYLGEGYNLALVRDISQRKQTEARELQANKMSALGLMAGGIAHDFNNILTPIMMHTQLLLRECDPASSQSHSLGQVLQAAERASALVRQILDFSRLGKHQPLPVKLSIIIEEAVKFLKSVTPANIKVRHLLNTDQDSLTGDPTQLLQVIMNLCLNAIHAMGEKEGVLTISLDGVSEPAKPGAPAGHWLKLTVQDTGSGIAPEHLDKLFDPFFTTKEKGAGTGMGLPVVHGIVSRHGGRIEVSSRPGQGASFSVFLPALAEEIQTPAMTAPPPKGRGEEILLVDDEPAVLEATAAGLNAIGYRVTTAPDGVTALELLRRQAGKNFALLLTDYSMPKIKGTELAAAAKAIRADLPIILCSGYSSGIDEETAAAMGISALIAKPLRQGELAREIRRVLNLPRPPGE